MFNQYQVRYGRNYKVVLAIVLPSLLIVPFILVLRMYPSLEEWKVWTIIITFLGAISFLSVWLAIRVYPPTILGINGDTISFSFKRADFLSPSDFSFKVADITSITPREIRGDQYYIFEISNPSRKFQVSSASYDWEDSLSFEEAMAEIGEMVKVRDLNN
ncbi:MAG: hypothetical protein H7Y07_17875 [Pyrinomonadaceae bacterium]|nr:hypothetical protein [Sphingobacteriaceae bacterium]